MKKLILPGMLLATLSAGAQLYIDNATFFIDNGAVVTVQGDVFSNVNIQAAGTGKLRMGGTSTQNLNMNGNVVPNLQIDNSSANVVMTGAVKVSNLLEFTNGKIQLAGFDLTLAAAATASGAGSGKFAETNGAGTFKKEMGSAGSFTFPVGNGSTYTPLAYTVAGGTYIATSFLGVRSVGAEHPNKHPRSTDFLKSYWNLTSGNIANNPTMTATGTYVDPASVTGTEADIKPMKFDGSNWALGSSQDLAANTVTASITASGQDLYGMNKFILSSPKVFLQGAFNAGTGLMNDLLRNSGAYSVGVLPASNLLPTSDPYRTASYNTSFIHVNNSVTETISTDVLKDLASPENQIVDWVFIELRDKVSGSQATVMQTRSGLLQRDGDIVDVDGVSPIYFKNVDAGNNWVISVRHRNHLGISSNPTNALALGLATSPFDFTNTGNSNIFGLSGTNYTTGGAPLKNLMWAGNANSNTNTRYAGAANDKDYILGTALSGVSSTILNPIYSASDLNMNRNVRYSGAANDKDFLLATPLGGVGSIIRTQALPN